jgi:GNAT superfamily N-acetyltransferase
MKLQIEPLTPARWRNFETLFGPRGAVGGCWCMWWRQKRSEFDRLKGEPNRQAFQEVVQSGRPPGLLAYQNGEAVGWCAVAPRSDYPVLQRSPVLKPVDDLPVWAISCLFIAKQHRRSGVGKALIREAVVFARSQGAPAVEGYPVAPRRGEMPDPFAFTGTPSMFASAGFKEIARRSETRPIMRRKLRPPKKQA